MHKLWPSPAPDAFYRRVKKKGRGGVLKLSAYLKVLLFISTDLSFTQMLQGPSELFSQAKNSEKWNGGRTNKGKQILIINFFPHKTFLWNKNL